MSRKSKSTETKVDRRLPRARGAGRVEDWKMMTKGRWFLFAVIKMFYSWLW